MRHRVVNMTQYPAREVERIVLAEMDAAEVRRSHEIRVRYSSVRYARGASGWWRSYWYPDSGEDRPVILVRLPRPGAEPEPYRPYERRDGGRSFPLADWLEALVAIVAHEAEHARQHFTLGERREGRGTGRRRSQVEARCDLAAYRAWRQWRTAHGLPVEVAA